MKYDIQFTTQFKKDLTRREQEIHGDFLTPASCCTMIYLQSVVSNRQVELP